MAIGGIIGSIASSVFASAASSAIGNLFGGKGGVGSDDSAAAYAQRAFQDAREFGKESRRSLIKEKPFFDPKEKVQAKEEPTESIEKIIQRLTGLSPEEQIDYATHYHSNLPEETKQIMLEDRIQRAIEEDDIEFADNLIEHDDIFFRHDDDDDDSTSKPKPMSVKDYFDMTGDYEI
tara:strand:+ start:430 stop:960 length:531 start_codon:yes stop_codon:yes gene_type:complete